MSSCPSFRLRRWRPRWPGRALEAFVELVKHTVRAEAARVKGSGNPRNRPAERDWATLLRVTVLEIPCPPKGQRFECNAYPAPYIRSKTFLQLTLVAELERAQFVIRKPQARSCVLI
jgi:hypothetical protein